MRTSTAVDSQEPLINSILVVCVGNILRSLTAEAY